VNFFARQELLLDKAQQEILGRSALLIAGVGGLGCPAAELAVRAGFGELILMDNGLVRPSDLNRQTLYTFHDIGKMKVDAAMSKLNSLGMPTRISGLKEELVDGFRIPPGVNGVLACLDTFQARFALDKSIQQAGVFMVHGGLHGFFGQVTDILPGETQSFKEIFAGAKDEITGNIPVIGPVSSAIASIMVMEAIKLLCSLQGSLINRMLFLDLLDYSFRIEELQSK